MQSPTAAVGTKVFAEEERREVAARISFEPPRKITVKQKLPMPDELLDGLHGLAAVRDSLLHIPVSPDDKHKTTFHARTSKLVYTCMPFGLVDALVKLQLEVSGDFEELM